jgi:hypothetical membrane protein
MRDDLINKIRQLQLIISLFFFIVVSFLCWNITNFDITSIQISIWGADKKTWWLFSAGILTVAFAILFNVLWWINKHKRLKTKNLFYILFGISTLCLIMVGIFPTQRYYYLHNIPAVSYFFLYPLAIFLLAYMNRKSLTYQEWRTHTVLGVAMIILPLMFIKVFDGMAISEIVHTIIVAIWNLLIIKKNKVAS